MLAWGCNAKVNLPPRFKNSGKHKLTYKHATAMEVLVGIPFMTMAHRCTRGPAEAGYRIPRSTEGTLQCGITLCLSHRKLGV